MPPKSPAEANSRANEIFTIVGISMKYEHVLAKFKDVDPSVSIPVSFSAFFSLRRGRCESLLRNLRNLLIHDANPAATQEIDSLLKQTQSN